MDDGFYRKGGSPVVRASAMEALAELMGVAEVGDVRRALEELGAMARGGRLTTPQLVQLESATDMLERIEAIDSPWVFGKRYMRHRFVSTDPLCPGCSNFVPHRTIIVCPTCGHLGPWIMDEREVASSHVHYLLVEKVRRLFANELIMPGGQYRADGSSNALPRGGAKSTWLAEIIGSWLLLTVRSRCLLLLSNTIKQVTERAVEIRDELEENDLIIADFGVQSATKQEKRPWREDEFVLANMGRCVARGAMQSMRGVKNKQYRPDAVIGDDMDDEKFLTTPDQAAKLHSWWDSRVVPACHPNAVYMSNGTVLGELSILWRNLTGPAGHTHSKTVVKAIEDRCGCNVCGMPAPRIGPFDCPICKTRTQAIKPCSFWGARFTVEALESIKRRVGFWAWQSEYQQEAHDSSTSWFNKSWIDRAKRDDLAPLPLSSRRIIPWSVLACTLTGEEAVKVASMADPSMASVPGDIGPYQVMLQCWDPAWARVKPKDQSSCWMGGISMGLTWDDRLDIHYITRDRGLAGTSAYRTWMYDEWKNHGIIRGKVERPGQHGMIVERNGGGILFQYEIEEHWGGVPLLDHQTGTEQYDLEDGIPGLASWFERDKVIIRCGGSDRQKALADDLSYELIHSGTSQYKDLLMATWFGWAYINRWIKEIRDPARYSELVRRRGNALPVRGTH